MQLIMDVSALFMNMKRCSSHQAHLVMRTVLSSKHKVCSGCVVWTQEFLLSPRIFQPQDFPFLSPISQLPEGKGITRNYRITESVPKDL